MNKTITFCDRCGEERTDSSLKTTSYRWRGQTVFKVLCPICMRDLHWFYGLGVIRRNLNKAIEHIDQVIISGVNAGRVRHLEEAKRLIGGE